MRSLYLALLCGMFALPAAADPAPATSAPATPAAAATTSAATAPAATAPAATAPAATTTTPAASAPAADPNKIDENSASYVDGYSDGCASANLRYAHEAHVKPGRDDKLYSSDNNYHEGWDHGYRKCEDRMTPGALPVMGNSIIM